MKEKQSKNSPEYEIAELKDQLSNYKSFFTDAIDASGIIEIESNGKNQDSYLLSTANNSFFELSGITSKELPMPATEAFSFLDNFSSNLLVQAKGYKKDGLLKLNLTSKKESYSLKLKKTGADSFLFSISNTTNIQFQRQELIEKKQQLKESQSIANIGQWTENHETKAHTWSDEFYKILNISDRTKISPSFKSFLLFVHADDKEEVELTFKNAIISKSGYEIAHRLKLQNGAVKHVIQKCYTNYDSKCNPVLSFGIIHDITAFEYTKDELRKSEEKFRSIFEHAPMAIVLMNKLLQPEMLNNHFCKILGYSKEEIMQQNMQTLTFAEDFETNSLLYNRLFKGKINSFTISKRYLKKDTTKVWVKVTVSAIQNKQGLPNKAIAMVQDISAEKKANEELLNSEYKYRTLIENANDGIGLFDLNMKPIVYNTTLYEMLGYNLSEFLGLNHKQFDLFHAEDKDSAKNAIEKVKKNKKIKIEKRLINKDGQYKHYSISYIPVVHEEKPAILIFRRDISKRKEAEFQNEEYRLFLETIMENLPVSLFAKTTPDLRYLYWNKAMELMTNISNEDAIGCTDFELFQSKALAKELNNEDIKVLKNKKRLEKEHVFTNIIGQAKQVKTIKTLHNPSTGNPIILGISVDITELKNIEKQVEQSDQLLKEAQKITKLGYWEYDVKKDLLFDNVENRHIFGTEKLQYFLNTNQLLEKVLPTDHNILNTAFKECVEQKKTGEGIIRIMVNNKIKHISINYKPVLNNAEEVIKLRGTSLDITRIRESEIALRESENRSKQAEHIAKVGYWNYDYITKQTQFSDEVAIILELKDTRNNIHFNNLFESVHPNDKLATAVVFHKSKGSAKPFDFDFRIITPKNIIKYIRAKGTFVKNQEGQLIRSIGTFQDITELKLKQMELEKYSNHLQEIQKLSRTGYIETELNTTSITFSDSLIGILETQTPLKTTECYNKFILEEDRLTVNKTLELTIKNEDSHNIQYNLKLENGQIKTVNEICKIIKQTNPVRHFITRIIQDITYIKEKEFALTKSELQLDQAISTNIIGVWDYNIDTDTYAFSKKAKSILNITNENENFRLKSIIDIIHPDDKYSVKKIFSKCYQQKENYTLSYRITPFNKTEIKYIKDTGRFYKNKNGQWIISGTISDISDIRETKMQLDLAHEIIETLNEHSTTPIAVVQDNAIVYSNTIWKTKITTKLKFTEKEFLFELINNSSVKKALAANNEGLKSLADIDLKTAKANKIKADLILKAITIKNKPALLINIILK